jgi:hypothetical protein
LSKQGVTTKAVERWKAEMPIEQEMVPRDKYTMFDRKEKKYRKGIHSTCIELNVRFLNFIMLTKLQNYQSGQEFRNGLTLLDTEMYGFEVWGNVLYVY